jgi:hypothetical protein
MSTFHPTEDDIYLIFQFVHLCGNFSCNAPFCPVHMVERRQIRWQNVQLSNEVETRTQSLPLPHPWYPCRLPYIEFSNDPAIVIARWFQSWDSWQGLSPPEARKYLLVAYYCHKDLLRMHVFGTELEGGDNSFPPQAMAGTLMSPDGLIYYLRVSRQTGLEELCIFDPLSPNPALHREAPQQPFVLEPQNRDTEDFAVRTIGGGNLFGVASPSRIAMWSFQPDILVKDSLESSEQTTSS